MAMANESIKVMRVYPHDLPLPEYATAGSAGFDLRACLGSDETVIVPAHGTSAVPTGFAFAIPQGYVGLVCARSGLAAKHTLSLTNGVGVIDSDYTGEIKVLLINHSEHAFVVEHGMRIAQMLIVPVARFPFCEVTSLEPTERADGGFGSTGVH